MGASKIRGSGASEVENQRWGGGVRDEWEYLCGKENVNKPWQPTQGEAGLRGGAA